MYSAGAVTLVISDSLVVHVTNLLTYLFVGFLAGIGVNAAGVRTPNI